MVVTARRGDSLGGSGGVEGWRGPKLGPNQSGETGDKVAFYRRRRWLIERGQVVEEAR